STYAMSIASELERFDVLNWWIKSGLELKYSQMPIDDASGNNKINVLNWWLQSGLQLKYSELAVDAASMNKHTDTLNWWLKSGLELKYSIYTMHKLYKTTETGPVASSEWWLRSGLKIKQTDQNKNSIPDYVWFWLEEYGLLLIY